MKKSKFKIEYPLSNSSPNILWNSIGTVYGLSEWFADEVKKDEVERNIIFVWDKHEHKAVMLQTIPNTSIRFQWEDDKGTDAYFEMKIVPSQLSNDMMLIVTDFAEHDDVDDSIMLWNKQVETLKRQLGM